MDGLTDKASYKVACPQLVIGLVKQYKFFFTFIKTRSIYARQNLQSAVGCKSHDIDHSSFCFHLALIRYRVFDCD